jgi:hypothetical protein
MYYLDFTNKVEEIRRILKNGVIGSSESNIDPVA